MSMNKYSNEVKENALNLYFSGNNISSISKTTGISITTVYSWITEREQQYYSKEKSINLREYNNLKRKCKRLSQMVEILKIADCNSSTSLAEKCEIIKAMTDKYSISLLCEVLDVAMGSYFNQTLRNKNGNTLAAQKRAEITPVIEQIFHNSNQVFGANKIKAKLNEKGYAVSLKVVSDIMHKNGWFPVRSCAKTLYLQEPGAKEKYLKPELYNTQTKRSMGRRCNIFSS